MNKAYTHGANMDPIVLQWAFTAEILKYQYLQFWLLNFQRSNRKRQAVLFPYMQQAKYEMYKRSIKKTDIENMKIYVINLPCQ